MKKTEYYLKADGSFVIEDYNQKKPFSNFFPGIAGEWGIPMWVFYTNRGQGIASFGIESKDKAIMEFQPANKAYRLTSTHGFRTFFKITKGSSQKFYEPFLSPVGSSFKVQQTMIISSHELTIEEVNRTLGIRVRVTYFTIPEEPFAGLMRKIEVENLSKGALSIEMIDGLPIIIPYGQNEWVMKNMCRTIEAWYKVRNLDKKAPYFQLNVEAADTPQVKHIKEGNFYFAFDPKSQGALLEPIVEAAMVFGQASDLRFPETFMAQKNFKVSPLQQTDNRTPSAMSYSKFSLKAGGVKEVVSVTGFVRSVDELNATVKKVLHKGFVSDKRNRNKIVIDEIKALAFTHSASPAFNAYAGQTFLDNVLRGGLPVSLKTSEGPAVFNVYSRKHGDLERDYNFFKLAPTFLSQGNGNYRDVNQNRRNDVWFNPDLKESSVVNFFSLSQADGYNPLVVCGMAFVADDDVKIDGLLKQHVKSGDKAVLKDFLKKGFMPGDLFNFIVDHGIVLKTKPREFLAQVLGSCQKFETAQHGEGFWTDHWHYNLDLLESYLALYPESLEYILLENKNFTFYHNSTYVQPRDKRYVLTPRGVRQYHSLHEGAEDRSRGHKLRMRHGKGEVYQTSLLVKLLCLIVNKVATLDPSGIGIDMEANKPNWYDSLNGLPGLLGSSISETFELKRFALFVLDALDKLKVEGSDHVLVFEELYDFIQQLSDVLREKNTDLEYWKKSNMVKEDYREKVREGISGVEKEINLSDVSALLELVVGKVDEGVSKARRADGLFPTYFYHHVTRHEPVEGVLPAKEGPLVRPLAFERHDLPLFLEGFVHALRSTQDAVAAADLHDKVRSSAIFDAKLKMYKVNANITSETEEIGRTRVFPRGWLENESIWLHMEYKYLLELLRSGLYEEFYKDFDTCCVAFMDPTRYGRSILENSSFIASSAHPDLDIQGQGFVARLSGSTAEFIHIWMLLNAGMRPFQMSSKKSLELALRPVLKGEFFVKEKTVVEIPLLSGVCLSQKIPANSYAFNFMGKTLVVYLNPRRKDTFGVAHAKPKRVKLYYAGKKTKEIDSGVIPSPYANDVRLGKVVRIDVELA